MIAPEKDFVAAAAPLVSALVVEPNVANRLRTVTTLASAGFHVTATDAFETARARLATHPPAVLVTALKLGVYNGLHLVLRAKSAVPRTAAVVTSADPGAMFEKDAHDVGATFVVDPVTAPEFLAAVLRTLFPDESGPWVSPPFERRIAERRRAENDYVPNRRSRDRRRDMETLLQAAATS